MRCTDTSCFTGEIDSACFRRSIRLEATRRALREQYGYRRQVLVWVCSFSEVVASAAVPAVHLVTTPYVTLGVLLLMFLLSSWRAGSVLDVVLQPAHLLRPKKYSRFGLGERQQSGCTFFALSIVIRLASAATLGLIFAHFSFNADFWWCSDFTEPSTWHKYQQTELQSDLDLCRRGRFASPWCETLQHFHRRCHDPVRWSSRLRSWAASSELGDLECNGSQTNATNADPLDLENFSAMQEHLQDLHGSYCETKTGKEISCDDESLETVVVWTDNAEMALSQICALWPSQVLIPYHCEIFFYDTDHCTGTTSTTNLLRFDRLMAESCEPHACAHATPQWLQEISTYAELLWFCECTSCRPWWRSNTCILDAVDSSMRRRAKMNTPGDSFEFQTMISDPLFVVQMMFVFLMVLGPLMYVLTLLIFCYVGSPWNMPANLELQRIISAKEIVIQKELLENGQIKAWCFNRLTILSDFCFCVADFVTDVRMIWIYLHTHHHWFAILQSGLVLRAFVAQLRHRLWRVGHELCASLRGNVRSDRLVALMQSERTGEATLSLLLQLYAFFYMVTDVSGYWTAAVSIALSACALTQGCYVHFDLAYSEDWVPPASGGADLAAETRPKLEEPDLVDLVDLPVPGEHVGESWTPDEMDGEWSPDRMDGKDLEIENHRKSLPNDRPPKGS
ncbi:unnamed protein product [Durusdinium trenchii]|uniref:Very-long-chain 3-oxoacyl-CoA synthase n=2 Tax=Durusdinium trenchii TaxID=1381693 RepID=A0ABP0HY19_9DINO